uniref:Activating transcription factor 7-interacting protein 2-like isoform X2 n=2 Tax=Hirondellea gigas TaxID=1518452 RepID=A0A6A7FMU3_9CRUS
MDACEPLAHVNSAAAGKMQVVGCLPSSISISDSNTSNEILKSCESSSLSSVKATSSIDSISSKAVNGVLKSHNSSLDRTGKTESISDINSLLSEKTSFREEESKVSLKGLSYGMESTEKFMASHPAISFSNILASIKSSDKKSEASNEDLSDSNNVGQRALECNTPTYALLAKFGSSISSNIAQVQSESCNGFINNTICTSIKSASFVTGEDTKEQATAADKKVSTVLLAKLGSDTYSNITHFKSETGKLIGNMIQSVKGSSDRLEEKGEVNNEKHDWKVFNGIKKLKETDAGETSAADAATMSPSKKHSITLSALIKNSDSEKQSFEDHNTSSNGSTGSDASIDNNASSSSSSSSTADKVSKSKNRKWDLKINKRHEYDFDMLLEAVDDVINGMKMRTSSTIRGVPYHRLCVFMKELQDTSTEEEEDEEDTKFISTRGISQRSNSTTGKGCYNSKLSKVIDPIKQTPSASTQLTSGTSTVAVPSSEKPDLHTGHQDQYSTSSGNTVTASMKGEVATASMPIMAETRSPMINIPAGIVKQFLNSDSNSSVESEKGMLALTKNGTSISKDGKMVSPFQGAAGETTDGGSRVNAKSLNNIDKFQSSLVSNGVSISQNKSITTSTLASNSQQQSHKRLDSISNSTNMPSMYTASTYSTPVLHTALAANDSCTYNNLKTASISGGFSALSPGTTSSILNDLSTSGLTPLAALNALDSGLSTPLESSLTLTPLTPVSQTSTGITPVSLNIAPPECNDLVELSPVQLQKTSFKSSTNSSNALTNGKATKQSQNLDVRNGLQASGKENSTLGEMNVLKRSLGSVDEKTDAKKQRLSPDLDEDSDSCSSLPNKSLKKSWQAEKKEEYHDLIDIEMEKTKNKITKMHKLKRKDLEELIVGLFMNKILHDHELGKYKVLCEKLETTLEANRKKTAQFHKEMEDLRKVTKRLREEHQARKDQLVTPIKIKRSVGIQAAPHIIQRGLGGASSQPPNNSTNKNSNRLSNNVGGSNMSATLASSGQMLLLNNSSTGGSGQPYMRTSIGGVRLGPVNPPPVSPQFQSPGIGSAGADITKRSFFLGQPLAPQNTGATTTNGANSGHNNTSANSSSAVIDLTDEEEGRTPAAKSAGLNKSAVYSPVTVTNSGANNSGTNNSGANNPGTPSRLMGSMNKPSTALMVPPSNPQHPAPLPRTAPQQVVGGAKQLPPQPTLKLSHKENSIVLSWTMAKTADHEAIASYQLYAYQESTQAPSPHIWKKVGSVKALELPMACTLTQFMAGHRYHFAVRAVDAKSRLGPFSDPRSIRLDK